MTPREVSPAEYANALAQLHAGMRKLDVATPHFTDRVDLAQRLVASRDHTPALADADRELLGDTLRGLGRGIGERGGVEQLLHGEPHPGNVLTTKNGLLFIDLETCCRGPVEFDLAHAPEEVSEHYPGVNRGLPRVPDPRANDAAVALDATEKDVAIGGAGLAAAAIELGLVDELRMFRYPVVVGGGTPFLPPVTEDVPLDLVETRTFGSRVVYERYRRVRDESI